MYRKVNAVVSKLESLLGTTQEFTALNVFQNILIRHEFKHILVEESKTTRLIVGSISRVFCFSTSVNQIIFRGHGST